MVYFDEEKQKKKIAEIRKNEEEELTKTLAEGKYHLPYLNLLDVPVENEALRFVPEQTARNLKVAPFKILGKNLYLAVKSPEQAEVLNLKSELEGKGYSVSFFMVSQNSLNKVWDRYREISYAAESKAGGLDIAGEELLSLKEKIKTIKDIERVVKEMDQTGKIRLTSRLLETILAGAVTAEASDVHLEPEEERVRLRLRLDGVLQDVLFLDYHKYKLLNSRIKLLSGLKLTITKTAQDGRFSIFLGENEINIRTSVIPGAYGESIVLRVLNPESIQVEFEELGIESKLLEIIDREIHKPNGLILTTGPTGSGKTTTLYAFLRRINSPGGKIITIEDPIEYHLRGITQTQTKKEKGYTFLEGLRSALRQDPDIIMVGEIRDEETAGTAVDAALTGHLVLSTLHTNSAAGVIPRLIDLKVNPKILTSALTLSIAQRLVRCICQNCRRERDITKEEREKIKKVLAKAEADGKDPAGRGLDPKREIKKLWQPVGCSKCNFTGYRGRIGIFEAILTDENIEKATIQNPSEREIQKIADRQGILNMKEDGIIKILAGITTLTEVEHAVSLEEN